MLKILHGGQDIFYFAPDGGDITNWSQKRRSRVKLIKRHRKKMYRTIWNRADLRFVWNNVLHAEFVVKSIQFLVGRGFPVRKEPKWSEHIRPSIINRNMHSSAAAGSSQSPENEEDEDDMHYDWPRYDLGHLFSCDDSALERVARKRRKRQAATGGDEYAVLSSESSTGESSELGSDIDDAPPPATSSGEECSPAGCITLPDDDAAWALWGEEDDVEGHSDPARLCPHGSNMSASEKMMKANVKALESLFPPIMNGYVESRSMIFRQDSGDEDDDEEDEEGKEGKAAKNEDGSNVTRRPDAGGHNASLEEPERYAEEGGEEGTMPVKLTLVSRRSHLRAGEFFCFLLIAIQFIGYKMRSSQKNHLTVVK